MADILIQNESAPTTPTAGKSIGYSDIGTKRWSLLDDQGKANGSLSRNFSIASQGPSFSADTYVSNSGILIPTIGLQAGMVFRWMISGSKTNAGVATAAYNIRLGINQSVADALIMTLTAGAQTAVADNGLLIITSILRNTGVAGILAAVAAWSKTQTGLIGLGGSIDGTSAGFDTTGKSGFFMGLSINAGAAAAWTLTSVHSELLA